MEAIAPRLRIAVIGAGVAGITAAYLLSKRHDVTLIERNNYLGGHTNTITVQDDRGGELPIDTGFIVCNPKTYPLFYRLLREWGVKLRDSDMSFGYSCERSGLGYVGPSLREFVRQYSNLFKPAFLGMIVEQRRFNRRAVADLARGTVDDVDLGTYLRGIGASSYFTTHYLLPLAAAVWSSPDADMLRFPVVTFLRFFQNHGLLELAQRPTWQTVVGGSHAYIRAFRSKFRGAVMEEARVRSVQRHADRVTIQIHQQEANTFDRVVLATHADEALAMLADPSREESECLSAWSYHRNSTLLHTDASVLPANRGLWASWNYRRRTGGSAQGPVSVTYYMNRLQGLDTKRDYFVSLNSGRVVNPASVIHSVDYMHPAYTKGSIESQHRLRERNGTNRTYFCGSYMGYGFHEDAVASAVAVAGAMGANL